LWISDAWDSFSFAWSVWRDRRASWVVLISFSRAVWEDFRVSCWCWRDLREAWVVVRSVFRESRSCLKAAISSAVGAFPEDSLRVASWCCSCPISSWRELIVESFSESEDLSVDISLSLEAIELPWWLISRLYLSCWYQLGNLRTSPLGC